MIVLDIIFALVLLLTWADDWDSALRRTRDWLQAPPGTASQGYIWHTVWLFLSGCAMPFIAARLLGWL